MRLWHVNLLSYLPDSQLRAQKREVDLIWKDIANGKKTNHILINYIWEYEYPEEELFAYYLELYNEFVNRGFKFNSSKYCNVKVVERHPLAHIFGRYHNREYMEICYYNLKEKYLRGQKDFSGKRFEKLYDYMVRIGVEKDGNN